MDFGGVFNPKNKMYFPLFHLNKCSVNIILTFRCTKFCIKELYT